jgi:hypothetical protein
MITFSRKILIALVGLSTGIPSAHAVVNPSSILIKIYEMRVSHASDCSNSIVMFSNPNGVVQDFATNPSIGSGAIPNGSYQCIMVKLSNLITFTPATTEGFCSAGVSTTRNVFQAGGNSISIDPNGNTINGIGTTADTTPNPFWAYFKVGGGSNDCKTPALACTLSSPINISGDRTGTLVVDFDQKIDGTQNPCDMQPPVFAFR